MTSYLFTYQDCLGDKRRCFRKSKQGLAVQRRWFEKNVKDVTLLSVEINWVTPLLVELGKPENEAALKRLRAKCQWEKMSLTKVLLDYGDPREWK